MKDINLRFLSREYAAGQLTMEEYRAQRAELLTGIERGTAELIPFKVPLKPLAPGDDTLGDRTAMTIQKVKQAADEYHAAGVPPPIARARFPMPFLAAGFTLGLAVLGGVWFLLSGGAPDAGTETTLAESAPPVINVPAPSATPDALAPATPLAAPEASPEAAAAAPAETAVAATPPPAGSAAVMEKPMWANLDNVVHTPASGSAAGATDTAAPASKKVVMACVPQMAGAKNPFCRDALKDGNVAPVLAVIPAGEFTMGDNAPDTQPARKVTIAQNFAISLYEISNVDYALFCAATQRNCPPPQWTDGNYPAVNVSWADAKAYTEWLSAETGKRYRLPSEAEWEYSARAGTTGKYPFGDFVDSRQVRHSGTEAINSPLPRADKSTLRNNFKLYHILGNVREWVADDWHQNYEGAPADGSAWLGAAPDVQGTRIARGGCYKDKSDGVVVSARKPLTAADDCTGFRVMQELDKVESGVGGSASGGAGGAGGSGGYGAEGKADSKHRTYTIKLFSVRDLGFIETLQSKYPDLELLIIPTEAAKTSAAPASGSAARGAEDGTRYRIFCGLYDSVDAAKIGWKALPDEIIKLAKKPAIMPYSTIKELIAVAP